MDMEISSGSEDGEAYVADLLNEFSKPDKDGHLLPFENGSSSRDEDDTEMSYRDDDSSAEKSLVKLSVEVPVQDDLSDYDFLPGHSTVEEIIHQEQRTTGETTFYVQLQSGEKKTVRKTSNPLTFMAPFNISSILRFP